MEIPINFIRKSCKYYIENQFSNAYQYPIAPNPHIILSATFVYLENHHTKSPPAPYINYTHNLLAITSICICSQARCTSSAYLLSGVSTYGRASKHEWAREPYRRGRGGLQARRAARIYIQRAIKAETFIFSAVNLGRGIDERWHII